MNRLAACPDSEFFQKLISGHILPDQIDELAQHLERCTACTQRVAKLAAGKAESPALAQLVIKCEALSEILNTRVRPGEADTASGGAAPANAVADNLLAFLSPPQGPNELGWLGSYRVLRLLGQGGMGLVLAAEDPALKRRLALKVMKPEVAAKAQNRQRFMREAQAAAHVEHPNIVPIYQIGEANEVPFIAMPFLKGEPLDARLRHGRLDELEIIGIGRQTAEGLAAAHELGLIHRDIKPGNIWLEAGDDAAIRVKILDFGLARLSGDEAHLTQSGAIVGTPAYMAPEQARGWPVDHRADLFSLGCVLYEASAGQRPFAGSDTMSILSSLALDTPTEPHLLNDKLSLPLSQLIMKLLEKDPARRPQTAREVAAALKKMQPENTIVVVAQSRPMAPDPWADIDVSDGSITEFAAEAPSQPTTSRAHGKRSTKHSRPVARKPSSTKWLVIGGGAAAILLALAAVFYFQTKDGIVRVETNDPDFEVVFDKTGPTIRGTGKQPAITLKAGEHVLHVRRGDLEFETDKFTLNRGETITLRIEFLKGKVQVVQGDKVIGQKEAIVRKPLPKDTILPKPPAVLGSANAPYTLQFTAQDTVTIPTCKLNERGPFTLEAYVRCDRILSPNGRGNPFVVGIPNGCSLYYEMEGKDVRFGLKLSDGEFYRIVHAPPLIGQRFHLAGVRDEKEMRLFIDGQRVATKQLPDLPLLVRPEAITIGGRIDAVIDEVRISKAARYKNDFTPAERFEPDVDTIALYHCDEGQGDELKDSSGNGHHGKIVGAKWVKVIRDINAFAPELIEPGPWQSLLDADLSQWNTSHVQKADVDVDVIDQEPVLQFKKASSYLWPKELVQDCQLRFDFRFLDKAQYLAISYYPIPRLPGLGFGFGFRPNGEVGADFSKCIGLRGELERGAIVAKGPLPDGAFGASANLKPAGEWNQFDLIRLGSTFATFVNGRFMGAATRVRLLNEGKDIEIPQKIPAGTFIGAGAQLRRIKVRDISAFAPELIEPGPWQALLDAELTQWRKDRNNQLGAIDVKVDGEPVLHINGGNFRPHLYSNVKAQNSHLQLEFQMPVKGPSDCSVAYGKSSKSFIEFHVLESGKSQALAYGMSSTGAGIARGAIISSGKANSPEKASDPTTIPFADAILEGPGRWNRLDLVRIDDRAAMFVNGRFLGALADMRCLVDGQMTELGEAVFTLGGAKGKLLIRGAKWRDVMSLPPELLAPGPWRSLFNGKDLSGWTNYQPYRNDGRVEYVAEDGLPAVRITPSRALKSVPSSDYHLRFEVKLDEKNERPIIRLLPAPSVGFGFPLFELMRPANPVLRLMTFGCSFHEAVIRDGRIVGIGEKRQSLDDKKKEFLVFRNVPTERKSPWRRIEIIRLGDSFVFVVDGKVAGAVTNLGDIRPGKEGQFGPFPIVFSTDEGDPFFLRKVEMREINALPPELFAPPLAVAPFDKAKAQEHQQLWANYLGRPVEETNSLGMKLRLIPPGEFRMGDAGHGDSPPRTVRITRPFLMGALEVTYKQFLDLVKDPTKIPKQGPEMPIGFIDWENAASFCERLSARPEERMAGRRYRLPTEAEWEYACRAGTTTRYHFGEQATDKDANLRFDMSKPAMLMKGGSFAANAWGLFDMHGNQREWCADWYDKDYPMVSPLNDPVGPTTGAERLCRGGGSNDQNGKAGYRFRLNPDVKFGDSGFRVVCEIEAGPAPTPR
jgi:serine/threonine protein kinase/formylglycine-generating enzyme required for sulfatase activity